MKEDDTKTGDVKKDNPIFYFILYVVFSACAMGLPFMFWKNHPAFYLACTIMGGVAFVISVVCLVLRLVKRNKEAKFYTRLSLASMVAMAIPMGILTFGTAILWFMN